MGYVPLCEECGKDWDAFDELLESLERKGFIKIDYEKGIKLTDKAREYLKEQRKQYVKRVPGVPPESFPTDGLSPLEEKIYQYVDFRYRTVSLNELSRRFSLPLQKVRELVDSLVRRGYIEEANEDDEVEM
ncbi:MAG: FeoC-like transcriptional regulator [Thermoproteota archaeon]